MDMDIICHRRKAKKKKKLRKDQRDGWENLESSLIHQSDDLSHMPDEQYSILFYVMILDRWSNSDDFLDRL